MQKKPLISVIITLYNFKPYIQKSLDSLVQQTYQNWELILVDDCSTDWWFEFISDYINKNSIKNNIILIKNKKNLKVSKTLEKALKYVKWEYVALLDADDIWQNNKLEKQIHFMIKWWFDLTYHDMKVINEKDTIIYPSFINNIYYKKYDEIINTNKEFLIDWCLFTSSSMIFKAKYIKKIIPFYIERHQDHWISLIISLFGTIGFLPEKLTHYRLHSTNISWIWLDFKLRWKGLISKILILLKNRKLYKKSIFHWWKIAYQDIYFFDKYFMIPESYKELAIKKMKFYSDRIKITTEKNKYSLLFKTLIKFKFKEAFIILYMR